MARSSSCRSRCRRPTTGPSWRRSRRSAARDGARASVACDHAVLEPGAPRPALQRVHVARREPEMTARPALVVVRAEYDPADRMGPDPRVVEDRRALELLAHAARDTRSA